MGRTKEIIEEEAGNLNINQNDEMMKLIQRIETEDKDRKQILTDCTNDEERINLRKKFIEKKIQGQQEAKNLMAQHKKEGDYLESLIKADSVGQNKPADDEGEQDDNKNEEGEGDQEQEEADDLQDQDNAEEAEPVS